MAGPVIDANGFEAEQEQRLDDFVRKEKSNPTGIAAFRAFHVSERFLERWDPQGNKPVPPKDENEYLERISVVYLFGERCLELGRGLCYDETKWDGGLQCRTCCKVLLVCASHPSLDNYWKEIQDCFWVALAAAGLATLIGGGGVAVFKDAFYACIIGKLGDWAKAIQIDLRLEGSCGDWHWCK